jgi:hypothetical protein
MEKHLRSKIEIIANHLVVGLGNIIKLKVKEVKDESLRLIFYQNSYSFIFLCSLHHLDMPWEINFLVKEGDIELGGLREIHSNRNNYKEINKYEITPTFLFNVDANCEALVEKIKFDVINTINKLTDA